MTLTLRLTPDQEEKLRHKAELLGLEPENYALQIIAEDVETTATPLPTSPAEIMAYWRRNNLLNLFPDGLDSPELARHLRARAEGRGEH